MPKLADVEPTPEDLLASGIRVIRETWACIRKGPYGKQVLLQTIYQVYGGWSLDQKRQIGRRLAERLPEERRAKPHLLELLIHAALPNIEPPVIQNWVDAIRLGEACHVRPFKLRGFLFAKSGMVRCQTPGLPLRQGWDGAVRGGVSGAPSRATAAGGGATSREGRRTGRSTTATASAEGGWIRAGSPVLRALWAILVAGLGKPACLGRDKELRS